MAKENGNFAGELEYYIITQALNFNIMLLKYKEEDDSINYYEYCIFMVLQRNKISNFIYYELY